MEKGVVFLISELDSGFYLMVSWDEDGVYLLHGGDFVFVDLSFPCLKPFDAFLMVYE